MTKPAELAHAAEKSLHEAARASTKSKLMNWNPRHGSPLVHGRKRVYEIPEPDIEFIKLAGEHSRPPPIPVVATDVPSKGRGVARYRDDIDAERIVRYDLWHQVRECSTLTIEQANAVVQGNKLGKKTTELTNVLPTRALTFDLRYPLSHVARVHVKPFREKLPRSMLEKGRTSHPRMTLGYLLWQAARAYVSVYKEYKRYGVWGHHIGDLGFESLDIEDNVARFGIGS